MSSYAQLVKAGEHALQKAKIEDASVDAWLLLSFLTGWSRAAYFMHSPDEADEKLAQKYQTLIQKRARHIPLQHITGEQEFMGLTFQVNENVLIPRPETELLVEEALRHCADKKVLDLCTGSGCIAVSVACLGHPALCDASDYSNAALQVAKKNALQNHVDVHFIESDLFQNITKTYDLILSNPPYISSEEITTLEEEVRCHDPYMALDGGEDGLVFYRRIASDAIKYLNAHGKLFMEIGYDQADGVSELLKNAGFQKVEVKKDLSGLDRMVQAEL